MLWDEIVRVLAPGGTYLSQQIGPGNQRALKEFLTGLLPEPQVTVTGTEQLVGDGRQQARLRLVQIHPS